MSKHLAILFCAALLAPTIFAGEDFVTAHSLSKQFVVSGPRVTRYSTAKLFPLDPNFLAISCERIKQTVLAKLSATGRLQIAPANSPEGKIYVALHPGTGQTPLITPLQNSAALSYRVDLPNQIEGARLIEAITEAVLLEIANRNAAENFAELPRWLSRGVAEQVKATLPETLLLQANFPISREQLQVDPIAKIRKDLENFSPLTFEELSWPEKLPPERACYFDECAHLFVYEIMRLKNGEIYLRQMLDELPQHLNWQVAFLHAFEPHFKQLVDVEKWWGLRLVSLSGRDPAQLWSLEQSIERLNSALLVSVQNFVAENAPGRADLTLQEIISKWDPPQQKMPLRKMINQLRALRLRIQPELVILLDEYVATLENYLENDEKQGLFKRVFSRNNLTDLRQATRERLDALDHRRAQWRGKPKPATREEAMLRALEAAASATPSRAR